MGKSAKRRVDSSDSDCAEANFEKKTKKATKKSKKANSDDEEFCTSAKLENTSEHKRTRKPQVSKNFNEEDEDFQMALALSAADAVPSSKKSESEADDVVLIEKEEILKKNLKKSLKTKKVLQDLMLDVEKSSLIKSDEATTSKEITIASTETCQNNDNTNEADPNTSGKKTKIKTPRSAAKSTAKKPKKENKVENNDQEDYSPKHVKNSNKGESEDENDRKSKPKRNSAKKKSSSENCIS